MMILAHVTALAHPPHTIVDALPLLILIVVACYTVVRILLHRK